MQQPSTSRISRKEQPPKYYSAYRKNLPYLLRDFERRCAYSMQHMDRAGGPTAMDIDHFNAELPEGKRNEYTNLFLATRHCNGHKLKHPNKQEKQAGLRFLNPCKEIDYGNHIFEDPNTFELWGATPLGRYHIRYLDLNADHLIEERRHRHEIAAILETSGYIYTYTGSGNEELHRTLNGVAALRSEYLKMIPKIQQKPRPQ